ncbi:hypothetical protein EVAR_48864_1 [Eumeta japonica]|uniref:Uncharacterized protein n=1 Tax=Eumeta variegata TaxID=151549 RepID=A0A4C1Y8L0_EUMVA|nr:hypothetical protein EVAR_48864_1 [Eumeta japonica]
MFPKAQSAGPPAGLRAGTFPAVKGRNLSQFCNILLFYCPPNSPGLRRLELPDQGAISPIVAVLLCGFGGDTCKNRPSAVRFASSPISFSLRVPIFGLSFPSCESPLDEISQYVYGVLYADNKGSIFNADEVHKSLPRNSNRAFVFAF